MPRRGIDANQKANERKRIKKKSERDEGMCFSGSQSTHHLNSTDRPDGMDITE